MPVESRNFHLSDLDVLDRFTDYSVLGEGAFGSVFKCWDNSRKMGVALKVASEVEHHRFNREFQILSQSLSERLVRVYDFGGPSQILRRDGSTRPHWWYSMELCGADLHARLATDPLTTRARFCFEMLDGLAYLGEKGIAHRDLKPKNLFLVGSARGSVESLKLGDFGIAKAASPALKHGEDLTDKGMVVGTFEYLAPERFMRTDGLDLCRGDQYAAGVIVYRLLSTGAFPLDFGDCAPRTIAEAHCYGPLKPLVVPEWANARPREVERVLARMMAKESQRRYDTIAECVRALRAALAQRGVNP